VWLTPSAPPAADVPTAPLSLGFECSAEKPKHYKHQHIPETIQHSILSVGYLCRNSSNQSSLPTSLPIESPLFFSYLLYLLPFP
jgi:hypothetical protein